MASQAKVEDIERRITVCRDYAHLWEDFFKCFGTGDLQAFQARKILDQDEARFAKIVTELARQAFSFNYFMGDKFGEAEKLLDILERAENLRAIQQMAEANFSKLEVDWHQVFIAMHRAVGRLTRELPPPVIEQDEADAKGKGRKPATKAMSTTGMRAVTAPPPPASGGPRPAAPGVPKLGMPRPGGLQTPPRPKGP